MITRRQFTIGAGAVVLAGALGGTEGAYAASTWAGLGTVFARLEGRLNGRLGVAVLDTGTGRRSGWRQDERFPMHSTFKLLACGAVLKRVDAGKEDLARRIRFTKADLDTWSPITKLHAGGEGMTVSELCAAAMTMSDNTAANLILASLGGPPGVTAFARSLGDGVTRLDRTEPTLNRTPPGDPRDSTTPDAMASDLQALVLGDALSRRSRDQLAAWMLANRTGDAKLRAGVPAGWRVADKTGSGGKDIGVLWPPGRKPLVMCVYTTATASPEAARSAVIAAVARAVAAAAGA